MLVAGIASQVDGVAIIRMGVWTRTVVIAHSTLSGDAIGVSVQGTASVLQVSRNFPSLGPIATDASSQLLGGLSVATPDSLRLYDVTDPSNITGLDTENFATDNANADAVGAVTFGASRQAS